MAAIYRQGGRRSPPISRDTAGGDVCAGERAGRHAERRGREPDARTSGRFQPGGRGSDATYVRLRALLER
ncbi:hypothetical protein GUJ93_ZPchr0011g26950 [Zizania palustris]|uniref:Uncharacterized protein n=1 Tax=Zizania palustris TaxID=103762 RepID=A0A8J5WF01_ZIZPA|nr:hypothetical protein GUJ93_ZPchr0011g26950 [Zizania palustris]